MPTLPHMPAITQCRCFWWLW